jgi:hypothetical protein
LDLHHGQVDVFGDLHLQIGRLPLQSRAATDSGTSRAAVSTLAVANFFINTRRDPSLY